jgi:hypothetical protein
MTTERVGAVADAERANTWVTTFHRLRIGWGGVPVAQRRLPRKALGNNVIPIVIGIT